MFLAISKKLSRVRTYLENSPTHDGIFFLRSEKLVFPTCCKRLSVQQDIFPRFQIPTNYIVPTDRVRVITSTAVWYIFVAVKVRDILSVVVESVYSFERV